MQQRIAVAAVDVNTMVAVDGLDGYTHLRALFVEDGYPLDYMDMPLSGAVCSADELRAALTALPKPTSTPVNTPLSHFPAVTVAICTRDRAHDLRQCLDSLLALDYPTYDVLVVDNAPSTDATERMLRADYPQVQRVDEPKAGVVWARNRALREASGEIVAFIDDDATATQSWLMAMVRNFLNDERVASVGGLTMPADLMTDAQQFFESYFGFERGFQRRTHDPQHDAPLLNPYNYGSSANLAVRKASALAVGGFDTLLANRISKSAEDLELLHRLMAHGYVTVYEPGALVWHRHRRDYSGLHRQFHGYGKGFAVYLVRQFRAYPGKRGQVVRLGVRYSARAIVYGLLNLLRGRWQRARAIAAQLGGLLTGFLRFDDAQREAK